MTYLEEGIQNAYNRWCEPGDRIRLMGPHFVSRAGDPRNTDVQWVALWCGDDHLGNYLGAEEAATCLRSHLGGCDA